MTYLPPALQPWFAPFVALLVSLVAWRLAQKIFQIIPARSPFLLLIHDLAPTVSRFVLVVGFRMAIDASPLPQSVTTWLDHGLYLFVITLVLSFTKKAAYLGIDWATHRSTSSQVLEQGFVPILRNVITLFIFLTGSIMVLKHFNYDVMSLITALGVGSFAVGLASKETLSNMISGFTLVIDRNLKIGDQVNLGGVTGEVDEIGLRSTRVRTGDGNTLIVPNAELVNTRILNLSWPSRETVCSTQFRVGLEVPFEKVRTLCADTLKTLAQIHESRPRSVLLTSLSEGNQLITVAFWVNAPGDQAPALSDFHARLLQLFRSEQISLVSPLLLPRPAP